MIRALVEFVQGAAVGAVVCGALFAVYLLAQYVRSLP